MKENTYNGWRNYETWRFFSEIDADEEVIELLTEKEGNITETIRSLAYYLREYCCESMPRCTGFYSDFLMSAILEIDFEEIAKTLIDDNYKFWMEEQGGKNVQE